MCALTYRWQEVGDGATGTAVGEAKDCFWPCSARRWPELPVGGSWSGPWDAQGCSWSGHGQLRSARWGCSGAAMSAASWIRRAPNRASRGCSRLGWGVHGSASRPCVGGQDRAGHALFCSALSRARRRERVVRWRCCVDHTRLWSAVDGC